MSLKKISKLLFVDDDANIRTIAEIGLTGLTDWNVKMAASGTAALNMVSEEVPDVILLDMMMPELDGIATLSRLRESPHTKDVPVLFITAKVQPAEVEQYLRLGVAGVITKPFDPLTLPKEIEQAVFRKGAMQ